MTKDRKLEEPFLIGGGGGISMDIHKLDAELNEQFSHEKSRTVKMCILKYKCILMFTFMFLCFLQFMYILFKEYLNDDQFKNRMYQIFDKHFSSDNKTQN